MTTVVTRGAASAQALGYASSSAPVTYIEDVFSTYLYTGNGSTQTITTGVDTGTKGGLIWVKKRSATDDHALFDSVRASGSILSSNLTDAATAGGSRLALTSTGFDLQAGGGTYNQNSFTYASWTFRKQPKFFDIVTYTGTGSNTTIAHALGAVPGSIIVKRTDTAADWAVYHRSLANTEYLVLNSTAAKATGTTWWNSTTPTSSVFSLGTDATVNASAGTYVAYLFAHNAGGFGLTGTDNVISCGSFTTDGSGNATVSLGYEPQWLVFKPSSGAGNWQMVDNMRGWTADGTGTARLFPNTSGAEVTTSVISGVNATGFNNFNGSASTDYIYIAIRRGPMKVPTDATKVFTPVLRNGTGSNATVTSAGGVVDLVIPFIRNGAAVPNWFDRLRGRYLELRSNGTNQENSYSDTLTGFDVMTGFSVGADAGGFGVNTSGQSIINWAFRRAPGFFDEVCYTGTGSATTVTHNLGVAPELMIIKLRSAAGEGWPVYHVSLGASSGPALQTTGATYWGGSSNLNSTAPTSSVFTVGTDASTNGSSSTFVAYLFATLAGVSKVGSYTGTGTTQVINCGFTAGARFVLIKRTDSTGDWYVWDSARGIVAGNDPYLLLNSTAAEVTSTDYVDTAASGFEISSTAPAAINANGGAYIFLAIA